MVDVLQICGSDLQSCRFYIQDAAPLIVQLSRLSRYEKSATILGHCRVMVWPEAVFVAGETEQAIVIRRGPRQPLDQPDQDMDGTLLTKRTAPEASIRRIKSLRNWASLIRLNTEIPT